MLTDPTEMVHFKHPFHAGLLETEKLGLRRQQLATSKHKMEFPMNGCRAIILKAACAELLVCKCDQSYLQRRKAEIKCFHTEEI